jgi:low temperature requirement protein LtrA
MSVEAAAPAGAERVSTLELFFDLVFVFTITQLSAALAHELSWTGLLHVAVMLGLIFWMYGGYAWLTNAVSTERGMHRALLLGGMSGYLVLALAIPDAFGGTGLAFGLGYLVVVSVHTWLFVYGSRDDIASAFLRIAPSNAATAGMVVLGGALGGTAQTALWAAAVLAEWVTPKLVEPAGFDIAPAHFVERHGLVVIVAIGESVVAIGIGAAGLPVTVELCLVAVLGLLLSAALWWTYFGGRDDAAAERAMHALPRAARGRVAIDAFGYAHLVMLLGIVCVAVGLKKATGHAYGTLHAGEALALAGGVSLFLAGDVWFRRALRIGRGAPRALAAAAALATVALGTGVAAIAQVAVLACLLAWAAAARDEAYVPTTAARRTR